MYSVRHADKYLTKVDEMSVVLNFQRMKIEHFKF
jgi:hypothetical protein